SIDWWTLDRAEAEKAWSGLWQWLEEFYLPVAHPLARPRVHQHQGPGQTIRLRSRTPPRHPRRETSRQSTSPPPHTSGGPRASKSTYIPAPIQPLTSTNNPSSRPPPEHPRRRCAVWCQPDMPSSARPHRCKEGWGMALEIVIEVPMSLGPAYHVGHHHRRHAVLPGLDGGGRGGRRRAP